MADYCTAGKDFLINTVKKIIEKRALPIYGQWLATDILISFVDSYYSCLGVTPGLDQYPVKDLEYALYQHLNQICAALVNKIGCGSSTQITIDLDILSNLVQSTGITPVSSPHTSANFIIQSRSFPVKTAYDALRYLTANQIAVITRLIGKRDLPLSPGGNWIWSGYTHKNEIDSVTNILNHSVEEYKVFVKKNRFQFPNSPYLDLNTSIIFEYEPIGSTNFGGPGIREHHVANINHLLPQQLVFVKGSEHNPVEMSKFPQIKIDGTAYDCSFSSTGIASFFFQRTPLLNLLYRMLSHDLLKHYDVTISTGIY